MNNEFDILEFSGLKNQNGWSFEETFPTDLKVIFRTSAIPSAQAIGKAIANLADETIDIDSIPEEDGREFQWTIRVRINSLPADLILWPETLEQEMKEELGVDDGWVLSIQTALHPDDSLTHFANLFRLFGALPFELHSILDLPTGRCYPANVINELFINAEEEPPEEILWITRLIEAPMEAEPEKRWAWISTHGLNRCGRVELEMLGVPSALSTEAISCVDGMSALTFERALPATGKTVTIGFNLEVGIDKSENLLLKLADNMPGREKRDYPVACITSNNYHDPCPIEVLELLRAGHTSVARTKRFTQRQSAFARKEWKLFLSIAQMVGKSEHATCMIQVPWTKTGDEDGPREYLWFNVDKVNEERVAATLAHPPKFVNTIDAEHSDVFSVEDITDWVVMTPIGPLGPSDTEAINLFATQMQN